MWPDRERRRCYTRNMAGPHVALDRAPRAGIKRSPQNLLLPLPNHDRVIPCAFVRIPQHHGSIAWPAALCSSEMCRGSPSRSRRTSERARGPRLGRTRVRRRPFPSCPHLLMRGFRNAGPPVWRSRRRRRRRRRWRPRPASTRRRRWWVRRRSHKRQRGRSRRRRRTTQ